VLFGVFGKRWLDSRVADPTSLIKYETAYRLHVAPIFAHHKVQAIRPYRVQSWIRDLSERFGPSTVITAFLVLQGILDLALADEALRKNPAKSPVVQVPGHQASDIEVWNDSVIVALVDAHPNLLRAIPELAASLGMREGELFGPAEEDIDLDGEKVVRVRRQVKQIGQVFVFALPKNDRERIISLSDWDIDVIRQHRKTSAVASAMPPPARRASTSCVTDTPASCSPEASPSRNWPSTSGMPTRLLPSGSTPTCSRHPMTAPGPSSTSGSPA
jgi:integrase